jgi:AraC-like DNA-binding protein
MSHNLNAVTEDANPIYKPGHYFEIDTPFIPAHQWPRTLIELALSRGMEEHKLLRGTSIFCEDIATNNLQLTPQQCFQLILNTQKHSHSQEFSFLLGHQILSALSPANAEQNSNLNNTANLQQAIDLLLAQQIQLMPLLNLRSVYEQDRLVIYWQDACGAKATQIFLLEMMFTALSSLTRWRSGESYPWQFYLTHKKPNYIEQYDVHLNSQVQFSSQTNAMVIARDYLYHPWKNNAVNNLTSSNPTAAQEQPNVQFQRGFLAETYIYLQNNIHHNPNLEQTAADFDMSSASFKRKLKKHHSHFQAQHDMARRDLAIMWLSKKGWTNEQVAKKLHFYDVANLRRAFKKWTGKLPQAIEKIG